MASLSPNSPCRCSRYLKLERHLANRMVGNPEYRGAAPAAREETRGRLFPTEIFAAIAA